MECLEGECVAYAFHMSLRTRGRTFHRWGGHVFIVDVQPVR